MTGDFSFAQEYLSPHHPDYEDARMVFDRVWAAFGNHIAPPELAIRKSPAGTKVIAQYQSGVGRIKPTIVLDAGLIPHLRDVFKGEYAAALACVIGHELAHHHYRHSSTANFAATSAKPHIERQADESGFFYAYLAGFPSFSIAEKLFGTLYQKYGLDTESSAGYPSGKERIGLVREQVEELKINAQVYETGKVLMLIGKTKEAIECLEMADAHLPASEVKQNLGLAYLLEATRRGLIPARDMPFFLPFETDMAQRLLLQARGLTDEEKKEKDGLLKKSEMAFLQARSISGSNASIVLNLAIVQLLSDNTAAATGTINSMVEKTSEAYLVRGIAYLKEGQKNKAAGDFSRIEKEEKLLFRLNSEVYQKVLRQGWDAGNVNLSRQPGYYRQPGGESLPDTGVLLPLPPLSLAPFPITVNKFGFGELFKCSIPGGRGRGHEEWVVAKVDSKGIDNQLKVGIGAPEQSLTGDKGYGTPDFILNGTNGRSYYAYRQARIIFVLDNRKVSGWYVYQRVY